MLDSISSMIGGTEVAARAFHKDSIDTFADGTCVIYRRADAAKKGVRQARVRVAGAKGYSTRSTKQTSLELAKKRAIELLEEAKINVALGHSISIIERWRSLMGG